MAKGLGGGFPIGAIWVNEENASLTPGSHGTTFEFSLGCSAAHAVLDIIEEKTSSIGHKRWEIF